MHGYAATTIFCANFLKLLGKGNHADVGRDNLADVSLRVGR
jgi:hypothetical protein